MGIRNTKYSCFTKNQTENLLINDRIDQVLNSIQIRDKLIKKSA